MNTCAAAISTFLLLFAVFFTSPAQEQEPLLRVQLDNSNSIYGTIIEKNEATVTISSIWARNIVVFRDDIAEITQIPETREELFKVVAVTVVDRRGSRFEGEVLSADNDSLTIRTSSGIRLVIPQDKIQQISTGKLKEMRVRTSNTVPVVTFPEQRYEYWLTDRLYFQPTGFTAKQGNIYGSLHYIIVPSMTFGLHKYVTVLAGLSLIPFDDDQSYIFNPKVGLYQSEKTGIALSYFASEPFSGRGSGLQLLQGISSTRIDNVTGTLSVGWGFDNHQFDDNLLVSAGLDVELSRSTHLLAEVHSQSYEKNSMLVLLGFRFVGRSVSGDLSLWVNTRDFGSRNQAYIFPYFALYFHF